jgi:hypothetical protein
MKGRVLIFTVAAALTIAPAANAQFSTFASRAAFQGLLGPSITDDYSSPGYLFLQSDAVMSSVFGETVYQATAFTNIDIVQDQSGDPFYCAGCNGSFLLSFGGTSVATSGVGVFGVGFDFTNGVRGALPLYTAFVTFGDGSTTNIALPVENTNAFFGIASDELISSIAFGLPDGGTTTAGYFTLDNLTIGSAATVTPEPATMTLMATGLVGVIGAGLKRRRKA